MSATEANLDELEALAEKFRATGQTFLQKAGELEQEAIDRVGTFRQTMADLKTRATNHGTCCDTDMGTLSTQADGVQWTGLNREGFDQDKNTFKTKISEAVTNISTDLGKIETELDTNFNEEILAYGKKVSEFGDDVLKNNTTFATDVQTLRANVENAANKGWTSA